MSDDPFAPIGPATGKASVAHDGDWEVILPVPAGARAAPKRHPKLARPSAVWTYTDQTGQLLGYVCRFDGPDGKEFRPLTLWRSKSSPPTWRWMSWPPKRPLYGLAGLTERPFAPVVVT